MDKERHFKIVCFSTPYARICLSLPALLADPLIDKFVVDNNISMQVAEALRRQGFLAWHVSELMPSYSKDRDILEKAIKDHLIVITSDRDFGGIIFEGNLIDAYVVELRGNLPRESWETQSRRILECLERIIQLCREGYRLIAVGADSLKPKLPRPQLPASDNKQGLASFMLREAAREHRSKLVRTSVVLVIEEHDVSIE